MLEQLEIPEALDGQLWRYRATGRSNQRHHHAELELNLVTAGSGTYLLESRKYQIRRGDLLWLFPSQEHVLFEQSPDFEMWVAVFRRKAIRRVATDPAGPVLLGADHTGPACRRLAQGEARRLSEALGELAAATQRPVLFNTGLSYTLLQAWRLFESAAEVPVRDVHPAVERAARLVREHPASPMPLDALAAHSGLSPARLSRLFKQQTGIPLTQFRNQQRIARFLEIFGTGQRITMLDAALEAGFGSYAQFHRAFQTAMGASPGIYLRRRNNA